MRPRPAAPRPGHAEVSRRRNAREIPEVLNGHVDPDKHPRSHGSRTPDQLSSTRFVHQLVRGEIKAGVVGKGSQLVEDALMLTTASTRRAVRTALQQLAEEGVVSRRRRVGTTVRRGVLRIAPDDIVPTDAHDRTSFTYTYLNQRLVPPPPLVRHRLEIDADEVVMTEILIASEGEVIGILVAFSRSDAWPALRRPGPVVLHTVAEEFALQYGKPFGRMDYTIDAVACDEQTGVLFGVDSGSVLLVREQVFRDVDGVPWEFGFAHYLADRITFVAPTLSRSS